MFLAGRQERHNVERAGGLYEGSVEMVQIYQLKNRAIVKVEGRDARDFLQAVLTNDIDAAVPGRAIYAGLLTPQGKLLFDFFVVKKDRAFLLDVDRSMAADLVRHLTLYKLRSLVEISLDEQAVIGISPDDNPNGPNRPKGLIASYFDPRLREMGKRLVLAKAGVFSDNGKDMQTTDRGAEQWQVRRLSLGLPEAGTDFAGGECFPHDIAMDKLNGISFDKGCYVGQEVVSRMQHRGSARKRPMVVRSLDKGRALPGHRADILANGRPVGKTGAASGNAGTGVALVRLDRAQAALDAGVPFFVEGAGVELRPPQWADYGEEFGRAHQKAVDT